MKEDKKKTGLQISLQATELLCHAFTSGDIDQGLSADC